MQRNNQKENVMSSLRQVQLVEDMKEGIESSVRRASKISPEQKLNEGELRNLAMQLERALRDCNHLIGMEMARTNK